MSRNNARNDGLLNRRDLLKLGGGAAAGAAMLGACAPVSTPEEQPAAPAVVSDHPAALLPSGFSAELEWWTHTDHDTTVGNVIRAGIERFREANPGVSVELRVFPNREMNDKNRTALLGRQGQPTIFSPLPSYMRDGLLEPLSDRYFEADWLRETFGFQEALYWEGDTYIIPPGSLMTGAFYNKTLWQEGGLTDEDVPRTWDEMLEIAKTLTQWDDNGDVVTAGLSMHAEAFRIARDWPGQHGGYHYSRELGRVFDSTGWRKFMEFYIRAIVEEKVDSPKMPPYLEAFPTNRAAMTVNKGWLVGTFTNQFPDLEFGVFPTPLAADRPDNGWWGIADDLGFGYTVNQFASDDEKEAANALLRYLYGDDDFMGGWAVNSAAVPSKLSVREWPEFQEPKIQTFMLTAPYRAPFGGEEFPRQREIAKTALESLLQGTSIDDAIAASQAEMAVVMEQNAGTPFIVFEPDYLPPADLSVLEAWSSGQIAYPFS